MKYNVYYSNRKFCPHVARREQSSSVYPLRNINIQFYLFQVTFSVRFVNLSDRNLLSDKHFRKNHLVFYLRVKGQVQKKILKIKKTPIS